MKNRSDNDIVKATICRLIVATADRLEQSTINATAAAKLATQGKSAAALSAFMDVEPSTHDALDLFRAVMTLRSHSPSLIERKFRR